MSNKKTESDSRFIPLRVPEDLKWVIEEKAKENLRSRNSEIVFRLQKVYSAMEKENSIKEK